MKPATETIIALAVCAGLFGSGLFIGVDGANQLWQAKWSERDASDAQASALESERARADEHKAAENAAAIDKAYQEGVHDAETKANRIIADLHTGNLRLRQSLTCTIRAADLSSTNSAARVTDAASACGLSTDDAAFLIRFAERADKVAEQLKAAQQFIQCEYERGKKRANSNATDAAAEKKGTSDAPTSCGGITTAKNAL